MFKNPESINLNRCLIFPNDLNQLCPQRFAVLWVSGPLADARGIEFAVEVSVGGGGRGGEDLWINTT